MQKTRLRKYAKLIARMGANVQKGQDVLLFAGLDQPEFVAMVAEELYKQGARKVHVKWNYDGMQKLHVKYQSLETLSTVDSYEEDELKWMAEKCPARVFIASGNPDGMKGIDVAATLGILGGDADRDLEVLESVTAEHIAAAKGLLERGFCSCSLVQNVENLYILIRLSTAEEEAVVEIRNYHKNITRIEKNGKILFQQESSCAEIPVKDDPDKALLNIADIIAYGDSLSDPEVVELLKYQLQCNLTIAKEGLEKDYGAQVGKTLLMSVKAHSKDTVRIIAKAYAAAGSDARMNGCAMPVVINSGSGNQGPTVTG